MNVHLPWLIQRTTIKKINICYYSSLPYAVLGCYLELYSKNLQQKKKIKQLKWRNSIVTLRAPKHFKVGRQHFDQSHRIIMLTITPNLSNKSNNLQNITFENAATQSSFYVMINQPQAPLTMTKNIAITLGFKLKPLLIC